MRLRSINEGDPVTTPTKRTNDNKGNAAWSPPVTQHASYDDNDSIEDLSDIVSSSSDDDDEGDVDMTVSADTNSHHNDNQDDISDGNSTATANKSNVDRRNRVNWMDRETKKSSIGPNTVTP